MKEWFFWQAVHFIHCYLCVELGSSRYSFIHSHTCAIFQNSPTCTNQHHISRKNTVSSLFCSSLDTHTATKLFIFWGPMLGMFHFQATYLGYRRTRSPSRYANCSHVLLVGFRNKLRTRTSLNLLCVILPPHVLWSRKALRMVMSVRWKNSFLVHFHVLLASP